MEKRVKMSEGIEERSLLPFHHGFPYSAPLSARLPPLSLPPARARRIKAL